MITLRRPRLTIRDMHQLAEERGGKCLSTAYQNAKSKLVWECKDGHVWEAAQDSIRSGTWCPSCSVKRRALSQRLTIEEMHELARLKKGKCLSTAYVASNERLKWECQEGHIFESPPSYIKSGSWCPYCAGRHNNSIELMHQIAEERGGQCLSTIYKNAFTHLKFQCNNGHIWEAIPKHIKAGHWCPNCSIYVNEERCRFILEYLFDQKFVKSRRILGNGMELDGYNEALKLAFEYHGKQHFEFIEHFHKNHEEVTKRIQMDQAKEDRCRDLGIELLIIPYTVPTEEHLPFIVQQLNERGIAFINDPLHFTFDQFFQSVNPLNEIKKIAESKGGQCTSSVYVNSETKLDFVCGDGHTWSTTPEAIKSGKWCKSCFIQYRAGSTQRLLFEEMAQLALHYEGECLSEEYKNANTKLLWMCKAGHTFERTAGHVKEGRWCPHCVKAQQFEEIKQAARELGGECLSDEYTHSEEILLWKCEAGHLFEKSAARVKQKRWCPQCHELKTTILIEWNGETRNIRQWSQQLHIPTPTLQARYHKGLRGHDLFRTT